MPDEIVHAYPIKGSGVTRCCGKTPFELPRDERMTNYSDQITCNTPPEKKGGVLSIGGRRFLVSRDGDDITLAWEGALDGKPESDALFTPADAVALGLNLIQIACPADPRPKED